GVGSVRAGRGSGRRGERDAQDAARAREPGPLRRRVDDPRHGVGRRRRSAGRRRLPRARGAKLSMSAYTPHTADDVAAMLEAVGAPSLDALVAHVPAGLRDHAHVDLPPGLSEPELRRTMAALAGRNTRVPDDAVFLGAGAYAHVSPGVVNHV